MPFIVVFTVSSSVQSISPAIRATKPLIAPYSIDNSLFSFTASSKLDLHGYYKLEHIEEFSPTSSVLLSPSVKLSNLVKLHTHNGILFFLRRASRNG